MSFPDTFVWGAAAASYQVEGAADVDGRGPSVWDMFCREPGKVMGGDTGQAACDHYHRYADDVRLMAEMGLQAYRLSVSWSRVLPEGTGAVNEAGLAFYDRLVDSLLEHGIQPWVTLFHWDFPYELYCRGGWLNRDSVAWFAEYTGHVVDRLSDRVTHWITHNEPQCFIGMGHQDGEHAPGLKLGLAEVLRAAHYSLLAHGEGVQTIRSRARKPVQIGAAPVGVVHYPVTGSEADVEAARRVMFSITERDVWNNTWFADPMVLGHYPEDGLRLYGSAMPTIRERDLETICQPLDFYGVNVYHGKRVAADPEGRPVLTNNGPGPRLTTMGWEVTPEALYWGPRFLYERYGLPIVVTENGIATTDWVQADGRVRDPQRIDFVSRYLEEFRRAARDGVDARGYFLWSIMDNFEWAFGYRQRFGLIHVDYVTGERTPKDSARWYRRVIESNGRDLSSMCEC